MKTRTYFILTALSGLVGMLALIATNLFKSWIAKVDLTKLSDSDIDHLHFLATGIIVSLITSQIAIAAFVIFLILYLLSKNKNEPVE